MSAIQPTIYEIMCRLRDQTLQPCEEPCDQPSRPSQWTPLSAPCQNDDETLSYASTRANCSASLPNIHLTPGPRTGPIACRRLQRQLNVQLQSSKAHIRDVKALVEDMIMTNSQCVLRKSTSHLSLPSPPFASTDDAYCLPVDPMVFDECPITPDESTDEGFHDGELPEMPEEKLVFRRAGVPGGVRKSTIAAEWARGPDQIVVGGRVLVRSTPRMRRRSKRPSRPPE